MTDYYTKLKITLDSKNGDLEDYPHAESHTLEFDVTDLTAYGWMHILRKTMLLAGFAEATVNYYLGDE